MDEKLLLTVAMAQTRLSLGRTKVYQLIAEGELPACRIGRALRLPAKGLEEWAQKRASQPKTSEGG